tara:strand:+ start:918 stop:1298 length:381 start_codon:yes stop_codon:yes gene_type:complete
MTKFQFDLEEKDDRWWVSVAVNSTLNKIRPCRFFMHYGKRKGCSQYFEQTRRNKFFCSNDCKSAFKQKPDWRQKGSIDLRSEKDAVDSWAYINTQASFSTKKKAMEWMVNVEPLIDSIMEMSCEKD